MTVELLGLLPESVLHSGWFAVLAAFVAGYRGKPMPRSWQT